MSSTQDFQDFLRDLINSTFFYERIRIDKKVYVVALPIGNSLDITFRALLILYYADLIICEDTRRIKSLLSMYGIDYKNKEFLVWNKIKDIRQLKLHFLNCDKLKKIIENKVVAMVSDSGTPLLSDPGKSFMRFVYDCISPEMVSPIPGPSALSTFVSITGMREFFFYGFMDKKINAKRSLLNKFFREKINVIFFESMYRIKDTMKLLLSLLNQYGYGEVFIAKELTKLHEQLIVLLPGMNLDHVIERYDFEPKGEFVVGIEFY